MIIENFEQGSHEWIQARLGIPTASEFSKIVTSRGAPSDSVGDYMNTLLAEWYTQKAVDDFISNWMKRGNELEPDAANEYAWRRDVDPEKVGICYLDERKLIACSPDRLVCTNGLLEIKCPKASTMVKYLLAKRVPSQYIPQIQGQLWITGREWCDFMAYHPDFDDPLIIRVERNEFLINRISEAVNSFVDEMLEKRAKLKEAA